MRAKTFVTFVGLAAIAIFAAAACGKSSAPADDPTPDHAAHDQAAHDQAAHDHAGHDHAGHDHAASPAKAAPAPETSVKNGFDGMPAPGTEAFCPVMKQAFKVAADSSFAVYEGKTYVFCCPSCKEPFEKDPKKYLGNL